MVSDKALYYENEKTLHMTAVEKEEHPLTMQIFGHDIETMVYAAKLLDEKSDCDIIDINMGCPVNKIIKSNAGSALMKDIDCLLYTSGLDYDQKYRNLPYIGVLKREIYE